MARDREAWCAAVHGDITWCLNRRKQSSVQFSHLVMSDSLQPHGLQHARLPCPSPTPSPIQTHSHRVGDAIKSSLQSSSSLPAFSLSQHQSLKMFHAVNKQHTLMIIFYTTTPNLSDTEVVEGGGNLMLK